MANQTTPRTSKEWVDQMLREHYQEAREAKKAGRLVCWSTSIAPQELLTTMDIVTVYPENHAAAIGARRDTDTFIQRTEANGYSSDLCSYARVNLAYAEIQHSEAENMPLPDFLLCTSNICHTVIKWYENLSRELNIPLIMFDTPFNHTDQVQDHNAKYMKGQLYHIIDQLEEITGRKFDYEKLRKVMAISNETCVWWKKATELAAAHPLRWMGSTSSTTWLSSSLPGAPPRPGISSTCGMMNSRRRSARGGPLEGSGGEVPGPVGRHCLLALPALYLQNLEKIGDQYGYLHLSQVLDGEL